MISLNPQYIKDVNGKNSMVVLTAEELERIIEELEDVEDVKLYDEAKKGTLEFIDADKIFEKMETKRDQLQN